jgi:hypothetical protein
MSRGPGQPDASGRVVEQEPGDPGVMNYENGYLLLGSFAGAASEPL